MERGLGRSRREPPSTGSDCSISACAESVPPGQRTRRATLRVEGSQGRILSSRRSERAVPRAGAARFTFYQREPSGSPASPTPATAPTSALRPSRDSPAPRAGEPVQGCDGGRPPSGEAGRARRARPQPQRPSDTPRGGSVPAADDTAPSPPGSISATSGTSGETGATRDRGGPSVARARRLPAVTRTQGGATSGVGCPTAGSCGPTGGPAVGRPAGRQADGVGFRGARSGGEDGEHLAGGGIDVQVLEGQRDLADQGVPEGLRAAPVDADVVGGPAGRNPGLRVESCPIRSISSGSSGCRPASVRSIATVSPATRSHSGNTFRAPGSSRNRKRARRESSVEARHAREPDGLPDRPGRHDHGRHLHLGRRPGRRRVRPRRPPRTRPRRHPHRHRRDLRPVPQRGDRRAGRPGPARPGRRRDQVRPRVPRRWRSRHRRQQPGQHPRRRGGLPGAPAHRPDRPLPPAPGRPEHAHRGHRRRAGRPGRGGRGPAHRAVRGRARHDPPRPRRAPGHRAADRVLPVDPRPRGRTAAAAARARRRLRALLPAGHGFLTGRIRTPTTSPPTTGARPTPASSATPSARTCASSTRCRTSPPRPAPHPRRSRWPGCWPRAPTSPPFPAPGGSPASRRTSPPTASSLTTGQLQRLDARTPATGARHDEANMASIDR